MSSLPPKPTNSTAAATMSKPSPKLGAGNKSEKDNSMVVDKAAPVVKGPSIAVDASKNKAQNGKALPSNSGSLANMWGRASAKPKPPTFPNSTAIASVAGIVSLMFIFIVLYILVYNSQLTSSHLVIILEKKNTY